jgi:hypothetical protein
MVIMPAKFDRCVTQVKKSFADKYVKENGKQPGAKKKKEKEISSRAFAVCTKVGKEQGWL